MSRTRIESLLGSFPKLIPTSSQHTSVETSDVRYVYQPLEDLYILLITNKASNILQDIETLHLFARIVSDICRTVEEREILKNTFDLLSAVDEIVSLGYREPLNLMQVRNVLEMDSHEEKIQDIIEKNKELEAKEDMKRRVKQLEMQRREQQRRAGSGGGGSYSGSGIGSYSPVPRFEAPSPAPARTSSPAPSTLRAPAFKGSGMKLGSKKAKQTELLDALGGEVGPLEDLSAPSTPAVPSPEQAATVQNARGSLPTVTPESVHIVIKEQISAQLIREGGLKSMELKGDMNLEVSDAAFAKIKLSLAPLSSDFTSSLQFKHHPNVAKFGTSGDRVIALKDSSRPFPVNLSLAVLKWRYTGQDESLVPLSINCWPTPSNDGTCDVNIEYELDNESLTLYDVVISIPLPTGSYPTVSAHSGDWSLNASTHSLDWSIPIISADEKSGTLEFSVGGDDAGTFFPVKVNFIAQGSLIDMGVSSVVQASDGSDVVFSQDVTISADDYSVV